MLPGGGKPQAGFYRSGGKRSAQTLKLFQVARAARTVRIERDSFDSLPIRSDLHYRDVSWRFAKQMTANLTILAVQLGRRACTMIADLAATCNKFRVRCASAKPRSVSGEPARSAPMDTSGVQLQETS